MRKYLKYLYAFILYALEVSLVGFFFYIFHEMMVKLEFSLFLRGLFILSQIIIMVRLIRPAAESLRERWDAGLNG